MYRRFARFATIYVAAVALGGGAANAGVLGEARYSPEAEQPSHAAPTAGAATWQYAHPVVLPAAAQHILPAASPNTRPTPPQHLFGYPTHLDPLYEQPTRPAWDQQHLEWQDYDRPTYDVPDYQKPLYGLDAAVKPAYQRPLGVLPNDARPNNNLKNYEATPGIAPTMVLPDVRGPNYVIKPEVVPAYNPPIYDNPAWNHPEYVAPQYVLPEYAPPRELPVPLIGPPR